MWKLPRAQNWAWLAVTTFSRCHRYGVKWREMASNGVMIRQKSAMFLASTGWLNRDWRALSRYNRTQWFRHFQTISDKFRRVPILKFRDMNFLWTFEVKKSIHEYFEISSGNTLSASRLAWQQHFFLDIFCFLLWHLAEDEIRQLLEEKDSKNTWKKNIQSCSTSVSWIFVGKGDCRTNREKRNCSSFKKVLEREIYSFVTMFTMYNKTIIGFGFCDMRNYQCLGKSYLPRHW